ncbi:MAG: hypothetical protein IKB34_05990 [Clostridia bacterium]|nr:hypothetical protein [Clostridia bacterium]
MKTYSHSDYPIRIFGLAEYSRHGVLRRLPDIVLKAVPKLDFLGRRPPGARLCFRTDAAEFTLRIVFKTLSVDIGMSLYNCQSAFVFAGERVNSRFLGLAHPTGYNDKDFSSTFRKGAGMEDVTVWLPRNEILEKIEITVDDGATVCPPTPYRYPKPIAYYGSSITEGGCSCNVNNGYNAIISRHLDVDYYNFGFSGSAKGELAVADYISSLEMSIFVYDYDHNAPNPEHLKKTHEPFFLRIREAHPELPVIMMTRPAVKYGADEKKRREIVRETYENAVKRGDKNVYFIDGETFYGEVDRELCTVDGIHPNDLGFYRMAMTVEPLIKKLLEATE